MSPIMPRLGRRGSEAAISDTSSPIGSPIVPSAPVPPLASGSATEPPLSPAAHKKSSPELSRSIKRDKRGSVQAKLPPRPSTAGATMTSSSSRGYGSRPSSGAGMPPPLPPLPGSPTSPLNGSDQASHVKGKERETGEASQPSEPPLPKDSTPPPAETETPRERRQSTPAPPRPSQSESQYSNSHTRNSQHGHALADNYPFVPAPQGAVGLGFSTSYGSAGSGSIADTPIPPSHSSSSSSSAAGNWKRATRKLSFTAPMFGIGKRDKRDKDAPPSSFGR